MKAVQHTRYGSPEHLRIEEVERPVVGPGEVLVKIHATSINDWDWGMIQGHPFYMRLIGGLRKPKVRIPGVDVAGRVEAVGEGVEAWAVGDSVYGDLSDCGFGGFAEYVSVPEESLARMPNLIDFHQAAAIPHAATLALQGLREVGQLAPGNSVLINGAGGGVGTIGIQIARVLGASHVAGVDHGEKLERLRSLGFDDVIDYTQTDFTGSGKIYDVILDTKMDRSPRRYLKALSSGGTYVAVGGRAGRLIQLLLLSLVLRPFTGKRLKILAQKPNQGLDEIGERIDHNELTSVVDGPYPFEKLPEALQYFGDGNHFGKVIVSIAE